MPPVPRVPVLRSPNGYLLYRGRVEKIDIPDELFLRELLDLDPSADDAVIAFLDDFGVINIPHSDKQLPMYFEPKEPPDDKEAKTHVRDAALYLETAQLLTRHWIAYVQGEHDDPKNPEHPVAAPWLAHTLLQNRFPQGAGAENDEYVAWGLFTDCINVGLRSYSVRVEVSVTDDFTLGKPELGLYSALCLQIVNAMTEGATYRVCQNESCRRLYIRQWGRANHGQHRTKGVMYCDRDCARAQASRELRRRRKAAETEG